MPANALFLLEQVRKARGRGPGYALHIPYLRIEHGARVAITGPSGCGKSTALDILGLILAPDEGETFLFTPHNKRAPARPEATPQCGPVDVLACWRTGRRDRLAAARLAHMGYVLQTGGLLPFLSVRENMDITAELLDLPDRRKAVGRVAAALGVQRLLDAMPGQLSVGERQRVAIGRALLSSPPVVLADEPTAALDPRHADAVLDSFLECADQTGAALVLATHDARLVRRGAFTELPMRMESSGDGASRAVLEWPCSPERENREEAASSLGDAT